MRALLHIGIEKTGSTFLQDVCYRKTAVLREEGTIYPKVLFKYRQHLGLAVAFKPFARRENMYRVMGVSSEEERKEFRKSAIEQITALRAREAERVLFTSEHLSLLPEDGVADLAKTLRGIFDDVEVCVFLRRQDHLAVSAYSESIRSGATGDFGMPEPPRYDFSLLLAPWERYFGRSSLSVFNFTGSSFRQDFFEWVGVPQLASEDSSRFHASLDAEEIELLRQYNRLFPRFTSQSREELRQALLREIDGREKGPKMSLSEDQICEIKRRYAESNAFVSKRYMDGKAIFG